jgi:hypothetical protein
MSKFANTAAAQGAGRRAKWVAAAAVAALLVPMIAVSGLVETPEEDQTPLIESKSKPKPAPSGYVLRCWQEGRLIVEENYVTLPPGMDLNTSKLKVFDSANRPVYVAETKNATCLIRSQTAEKRK